MTPCCWLAIAERTEIRPDPLLGIGAQCAVCTRTFIPTAAQAIRLHANELDSVLTRGKMHRQFTDRSPENPQNDIADAELRTKAEGELLAPATIRSQNPHLLHALTPTLTHSLLLVSDSALPLGSFAFSSGLESFLAHHRPFSANSTAIQSFHKFFFLSLASMAGTALPYVIAAYRDPQELVRLDDDLDASTPCTVARRASLAQGRALLGVWKRSLASTVSSSSNNAETLNALQGFEVAGHHPASDDVYPGPKGHLPVVWGAVCSALNLSLESTTYIFLFKHVQSLLSAAVRASVMGPYQAQGMLASGAVQEGIKQALEQGWKDEAEEAEQTVPVMDLWVGRHELLYSRIFNS